MGGWNSSAPAIAFPEESRGVAATAAPLRIICSTTSRRHRALFGNGSERGVTGAVEAWIAPNISCSAGAEGLRILRSLRAKKSATDPTNVTEAQRVAPRLRELHQHSRTELFCPRTRGRRHRHKVRRPRKIGRFACDGSPLVGRSAGNRDDLSFHPRAADTIGLLILGRRSILIRRSHKFTMRLPQRGF